MESNLLGLHLPVLDINLVSAEHNWDVLTHTAILQQKTLTRDINVQTTIVRGEKSNKKHTGKDHGATWEHSCKSTEQLHQT